MTRGEFFLIFSVTVITTGGLLYQFNFNYPGSGNRTRAPLPEGSASRGGDTGAVPAALSGAGTAAGTTGETVQAEIGDTVIEPETKNSVTIKEIRRKDARLFLLWEDRNPRTAFYRVFISARGDTRRIDAGGFMEWELSDLTPGTLYIVHVGSYDRNGLPLEKSRRAVVLP